MKPLFVHQKKTIKLLKKEPRVFDQSDPGVGKSRCQIEDFAARRRKGAPPAIVLATRSTLRSAWEDDFNEFAPDMKVSVALAANRQEAFDTEADVYVTNHDAVNWLSLQKKPFWKKFEGGTIVADESTAYKHGTSKRARSLAKIVGYFEHRRNLSGLASPNGILDLWHQYYLLDGGKRLGNSFFKFRGATCVPEQIGKQAQMIKWNPREGIEAIVASLVSDITIRHIFEECVDIPQNFSYTRSIDLGKKHAKCYAEMQDTQLTSIKGKTVTAINKAVVRIKLLQIGSGAVYSDDKDGTYVLFDSTRYEYVADLSEEAQHSIVFFQWKHQRDELVKEFTKRGRTFAVYDGSTSDDERSSITKAYQRGELNTILAHPKSAAHGLTWTKGTRTIWASPTDNLEFFIQGNKRIYRIGQTQKTETITVVAKGTYDEIAMERLGIKAVRSDELSKALRALT